MNQVCGGNSNSFIVHCWLIFYDIAPLLWFTPNIFHANISHIMHNTFRKTFSFLNVYNCSIRYNLYSLYQCALTNSIWLLRPSIYISVCCYGCPVGCSLCQHICALLTCQALWYGLILRGSVWQHHKGSAKIRPWDSYSANYTLKSAADRRRDAF